MANILKINRTAPGNYDSASVPSSLNHGELGFDNHGEKLFIGKQTTGNANPTTSHTSVFHLSTLKDLTATSSTGIAISAPSALNNNARAISGINASTSVKGVASFNDTFFSASSGAISLDAAQTGLTSILNAALVVGRDADNVIDFATDNEIDLKANGEVVATVTGAQFQIHGDNDLVFFPGGTTAATTMNTQSAIEEVNTSNTAGHGNLRIGTAGLRQLDFVGHASTQDYVAFNEGGADIDFRVYDDNANKQIDVVAVAGSPMTTIRDLTVSNSVTITPQLNVTSIDASSYIETPAIRGNGSGSTQITIDTNDTTIENNLKIGQVSNSSDLYFEGASNSFSDSIRKTITSGSLTILNAVAGSNESVNELMIHNSIQDGDIILKINDGGVAKNAIHIDGATAKVTILGDLEVDGTTTQIDSTTLTVADKDIVVANGAGSSSAADGAGIIVGSDVASIKYIHTGTKWALDKNTAVTGTFAVSSTSTFTGAITGSGGFTNTTFDCGTF
jgi:hypothetical protein